MFKGLKIVTQNAIINTDEDLKIVSTTCAYLQKEILGKKVRKPLVGCELVILLNSTDTLYTSKVKEFCER